MKRKPLLQLLIDTSPGVSKETLYAHILSGDVRVDGERIRDPKRSILLTSKIEIAEKPYVSRGGLKLDYAISRTNFTVAGRVAVDVGASTGGFAECLLKHGVSRVHTVDVGSNQLAYSLRADSRIIVHEKTNIMDVSTLDPQPHVATADISFRSILGAAGKILSLTSEKRALVLIKPQFERRKTRGNFDGVVRSSAEIHEILLFVLQSLEREGVYVEDMTMSPIEGRKGNREFFYLLSVEKGRSVSHPEKRIAAVIGEQRGLSEGVP